MAACSRQRPKGVIFLTIRMRKVSGLRASGRPSEKTSDWYAQVNHGKVWYLGEDAFEFVDGHWVPSRRFLEAGRGGALPGIIREAHPKVGDPYRQEYYAGHAEDMATVLDTHTSVSVPYGTFHHALSTSECTPLVKYHAR